MSNRSDTGRKIATNVSEPMKASLVKLADRNKVTLAEYVRKVLFDHVQAKLDGVKTKPVVTGSFEHSEERAN